ncbi:undecaprenyl-diphosphatase [Sorangium cellulosum So ce56]|uniref:Undecaprenyl-diphosphatase n=1 Tax=Sorangium cellulosum (strain So ce56) TaxID=448385 RepID=UPPP_SORC5|nr:undecaprenyl-diphosphate phosphatase [Sorangium cellulosum]A9GC83.1 RecName: Full=Undecaprenyl-diphosphatase; AltName: Full=Bacitracin resistance protein; AltName: Full=Undecaprenyl pyrophosphate phosphatase [Sorangium cellulosum So ce56]CAN96153.1 undecaprenyl-diphosphatase [Sorangium cellulosum So ce56]
MFWFDAVLLGVLEGLTEFLPVSSTGHLILLGAWLGHQSEAAKTLDIVIQLGAVLAVVVYFRERLSTTVRGMVRRDPDSLRLALALAFAFLPAAVVGLLFHKAIKAHLFGPGPVAAALIVGGFLMIGVESLRRRRPDQGAPRVEDVTFQRALAIGFAQCFSLWPGASRSMTTIVGGQLSGLSTAAAAEFSFLLAIPTLGAATVFDLVKNGRALLDAPGGIVALVVGLAVSFAVALLVIAVFLRYLKRYGLAPFGWYRIALGALVLWLWIASRSAPAEAGAASASPAPRGDVAAAVDGLARTGDHPSRP